MDRRYRIALEEAAIRADGATGLARASASVRARTEASRLPIAGIATGRNLVWPRVLADLASAASRPARRVAPMPPMRRALDRIHANRDRTG